MGILNGKPKAPPAPKPYIPPPVTVAPAPPSEPVQSEEEIATEARTQSLLRRSRSRFGTIFTGFKGFLAPTESAEGAGSSKRKTLLGE